MLRHSFHIMLAAAMAATVIPASAQDTAQGSRVVADASAKSALLERYKATLVQPMMDGIVAGALSSSDADMSALAMCPDAQAYGRDFMGVQLKRFFREELIGKQVMPMMMTALDKGLDASALQAFLAFSETPDGQAYVRKMVESHGSDDTLETYLAGAKSPGLRSYAAQMKKMSAEAGVEAKIAAVMDMEKNPQLKAFMDNFQAQLMQKVQACMGQSPAAAKP